MEITIEARASLICRILDRCLKERDECGSIEEGPIKASFEIAFDSVGDQEFDRGTFAVSFDVSDLDQDDRDRLLQEIERNAEMRILHPDFYSGEEASLEIERGQ